MTKGIMGAALLVNSDNIALARDAGNDTTDITLRDGGEYVIDMPFNEFAMKVQGDGPVASA